MPSPFNCRATSIVSSVKHLNTHFSMDYSNVPHLYQSYPLFFFLFYHSFILHRLESRTRLILTPHNGWHRWDLNLHTPACESPAPPLCYGCHFCPHHSLMFLQILIFLTLKHILKIVIRFTKLDITRATRPKKFGRPLQIICLPCDTRC